MRSASTEEYLPLAATRESQVTERKTQSNHINKLEKKKKRKETCAVTRVAFLAKIFNLSL